MATAWDSIRAGWADIAASADAAWQDAYAGATEAWGALIEADPSAYADEAEAFLANLDEWDQLLRAAGTLVGQLPEAEQANWTQQLAKSREEWRYYGAGIYPHVEVEAGRGVGAVPVLVGAAVIVIGVAGVAWAVAYGIEAQSKRDWAFYSVEELGARVKSMESGKPLPGYSGPQQTTPAPPPPDPGTQNVLGWGLGLGLLGLLGAGLAYGATRGR